MNESLKKFLIETAIGLVAAILICAIMGLFSAESLSDVFRILSDGFFVSAAAYLAIGGITFTVNGGVFDGLGYTAKIGIARIKRDYETARVSFAEYREEREKKASSPKEMLLAGVVLLVIAGVLLALYSNFSS